MAIEMTSYALLSQETWRVSYATGEVPDISIEKLLAEIEKELPNFQMPIDVELTNIETAEGTKKRLLIKHKNSPYNLLHVLIGLERLGTVVYAERWNCLVQEPEGNFQDAASPAQLIGALLGGIALFILGLVVAAGNDGTCGGILIFVGLVLAIYGGVSSRSNQETIQANEAYLNELVQYWTNLDKAFLSQFDNTLYRVRDAAGDLVLGIVLKRLYPQIEVSAPEQQINREQEVREHLQNLLGKHKATGMLPG